MAEKNSEGIKKVRKSGKGKVQSLSQIVKEEEIVSRESVIGASSLSSFSFLRRGTVKYQEITDFLRQLIMLLESGTPLLKSLKTLAQRGQTEAIRGLINDMAMYVEEGNPLWQAFDRHPRYFDTVFVNLIKASEASGTLTTVLQRLVDYRQRRDLLRRKVRGALFYPIVLVIACLAVLLLLTNFVVPQFQDMYEKQNINIPSATMLFFQISNWFRVWWWLPIVLILLLILVYQVWFIRNPLRRLSADRFKLKIPIIGKIMHKYAIVEMMRTWSLLLKSGLSMMSSLELTKNAIHNQAVAQSLQTLRDSVERGAGLETPLRASADVIPPVVADMLITGEESGSLDKIAEQIADIYDNEVQIAVNTLGEALQPIFTIAVGIIVVTLFVSLFYPMISMIEQISNASI
ncbi:MAG TPA: type II secretion system F family protein [Candidatus Hydrogenedens sp.]|nr:type II secretion system F family protein [Candidatus Hydrogenedens sp.]HOL18652.1 type II secretion system F family protein [Candidatus Hydrogenedens sp.]HPP57502.1 type II secretion system F family protein [Candidatus Hydrogenedens sp.]